jgi:hypothetical protein
MSSFPSSFPGGGDENPNDEPFQIGCNILIFFVISGIIFLVVMGLIYLFVGV